ncbi:MAG: ATP-dependent zinc metalloprotease FtsH [Clostridiales bacterium]|nr:ATP-dependent zinc metalloprotease FtsH [Clostridiales bacterium]
MKSNLKVIVLYIVIILVLLSVASVLFGNMPADRKTYSDIVTLFKEDQVERFEISTENRLTVVTRDNQTIKYTLRDVYLFVNDCQPYYSEHDVKYDFEEPVSAWVSYIPYVILIVLFVIMWVFVIRQASGKGGKINSFGKARTKLGSDEKKKIFFSDVAGNDEEKEELQEVVEFLKDPAKFTKLGARIPHGVLLVGPPGTGKTLLAKAVAGEAGVPFYSISGSDFVEMYVGVGASRVRDLFETAKKSPASIVFIDEIDAVGRHRGAGLGGGHDEREQTLNQLLVEMDGFGANEGVIVMAATNRPDILDPALLRPGRFDRQITIGYPDLKGREDILKVHAKGKPFSSEVNFGQIAKTTVGFTGADLANLLNEAALLAARSNKSLIGMDDIEAATLKIIVGTRKKSMVIKPEEKKKTAYHEAGHAIMAYALPSVDPVRMISIIPSGRALGFTLNPPVEDKYSEYKSGLKEEIAMLLGGRVAEKIIYGDYSGGASNDIQRATQIAKKMVTKLGMSDVLGPIVYGSGHSDDEVFLGRDFNNNRDYSEQTAKLIDDEIHSIIDEAFKLCEKVLSENINKLHFIAEYLVNHEVMDEDQFKLAMESDEPTTEALEAIAQQKQDQAQFENAKRAQEEAEKAAAEAAKQEEQQKIDPQPPLM